ncbi:3-oxoacyl-(acyl-carrier-protein) synthase III [Candidatus Magnetomoraceae bacterium gMMP-15]
MKIPVNIIGIGTYFPPIIKKNSDFDYVSVGISDEWVEKAGLKERRYADPKEDIIDLAYRASLRAIKHANIKPEDIDLLLLVSSTFKNNQTTPTGVANLQQKLAITECMSLYIAETCCGALMAIELGSNAIMAGQAKNVLVIASETLSKIFNPSAKLTSMVGMSMGDGAGAVVLTGNKSLKNGKLGSYIISNADFQGGLGIKVDEVSINQTRNIGLFFGFGSLPPSYKGRFLSPEDAIKEIKKFTSNAIPDAIQKVFEKSSFTDKDIDFYILHQPNRAFIEAWKENAGISKDKTLDTLEKYGNLSSVSVLANLDMAYQLGKIKKGDNIIIASVGEGANWGAMIWKWQIEPNKKHDYLIHEEIPKIQDGLATVENYSMLELWEKFIIPGAKDTYSHDELFSDFVPSMAIFEGVPLEAVFDFLSKTENLAKWTMSMRNIRLLKDDIYQGDEAASPTGKVFVRTIAEKSSKIIEWNCSHNNPDDLWMIYKGMLVDAEKAVGRKGTAFFWSNFVHERVKNDPMLAMGFKMMYSAHKIEINNLKMILEDCYGN